MYLWVILATFLASLAVFSTSYRPDIKKIAVEPKAEAVVAKMYLQHEAMRKFVETNWHKAPGSVTPGEWSPRGSNASYAPYGFDADGGGINFTSKIYCLASKDRGVYPSHFHQLPIGCTNGHDLYHAISNCCDEKDATMFLLTYGEIPSKWRNPVNGKPRPELLDAMRTSRGYINGLGYTIDIAKEGINLLPGEREQLNENIHSRTAIITQGERAWVSVPNWIMAEELDSSSTVDSPCRRDKHCLMYLTRVSSGGSVSDDDSALVGEETSGSNTLPLIPISGTLPKDIVSGTIPRDTISGTLPTLPKYPISDKK